MSNKRELITLLNRLCSHRNYINLKWERILAIADYSKVSALLFYRVKDFKEEYSIPDEVYLRLKNAYQVNVVRNTLILEEFDRLGASFKLAGIPIILLKGILLLQTIYQDKIGIRRMEDIDILIRAGDLGRSDEVLRSCGYSSFGSDGVFPEADMSSSRKAIMYFKYEKDKLVLAPVHLHWHFVNLSLPMIKLNWSKINMTDIWNASELLQQNNGTVFVMRPEYALLTLCEHGLRHGFCRLNILYDLHAFILQYKYSLDWDRLISLAADWDLIIPLYIGMLMAQDIFRTDIPEKFLENLRPEGSSMLERYFIRYAKQKDFPKEDMCILLYLAINQGLSNKVRFLFTSLSLRIKKGIT